MNSPEYPGSPFFRRITGVSLRTKIIGMLLAAILLIGLSMTLVVRDRLATDLNRSLEERGVAITNYAATRATDLVLTDNTFALYQLARDTLENNLDVRYVFVLDANDQVMVHSFPQAVPSALVQINKLVPAQDFGLTRFNSEEGSILDIAVPMMGGQVGTVRVGLSLSRLAIEVRNATLQLLVITGLALLISVGMALFLTRVLTQPILELVAITRRVGEGELDARARLHMADEVGELSQAFNTMAASLQSSHDDLLRRIRELAILNTTAAAISSTLNLQDMLQAALEKVLDEMSLQAGWIFIEDPASPLGLQLAVQSGISEAFRDEEATRELGQCICVQVLDSGIPLVVEDVCKQCKRLNPEVIRGENLACHASVPLVSRDQVIGVLNVASRESRMFSDEDLALLDLIGRQIGVAIENARLWEEVKEKDLLRGQLLEKIITAQEDERQRLARELHDEAGQALTSLKFSLRNLEQSDNPSEAKNQLQALRDLTGQIQDDLHDLALELHPPALDELGLTSALRNFIARFTSPTSLSVNFQTLGLGSEENGSEMRIPKQVEVAAYRMIQEALTNTARHANADHVSIMLEHQENQIMIIVDDDGQGFDIQEVLKSHSMRNHLGIYGMQERVELLGGVFTVESQAGEGTTVFARIPLPRLESVPDPTEIVSA
jgi:signal transduction histidine kinase